MQEQTVQAHIRYQFASVFPDAGARDAAARVVFVALVGGSALLACYMDDSADAGRKTVFAVAGFVGESDEWFRVARYWSQILQRENIDYFRTYECVNLEGEFRKKLVDPHGLTVARVIADAMLNDLKQIVSTSNLFAYSLAVLMKDYRQVLSEPDGARLLNPDPYVGAHHQFIGMVLADLCRFPGLEICAFLYDEHSNAKLVQDSWGDFKLKNPDWALRAGILTPLDDKQHIPIQIADLLAHTTTKIYERLPIDEKEAHRCLRSWLGDNLMLAAYVTTKYLRELVDANIDLVKSRRKEDGKG